MHLFDLLILAAILTILASVPIATIFRWHRTAAVMCAIAFFEAIVALVLSLIS